MTSRPYRKVCVLGLGYIGLPTAATLATQGFDVIGVDTNPRVINTLRNGDLHIHEPGLRAVVRSALQSGHLRIENAPEPSDVFIIAVPTPLTNENSADLSYVRAASESLVSHLRKGNLVILESTSPPGTTQGLVLPILEQSALRAGEDFLLAYSPERVLPGQILEELIANERVIGGIDRGSAEAARSLYASFVEGEIHLTDAKTAEMVKLIENTYRDINIALANELSRLAEAIGVDVWQAISLANRHPRVQILKPGPGVGGHCISIDPWFLVQDDCDQAQIIPLARKINDDQPKFVVSMTSNILGRLNGMTLAVLGLTYKPNVDDVRESPAISVIELLQQEGASVKAYDPFAPKNILADCRCESIDKTCENADCLLILVAHDTFQNLNPKRIGKQMKRRRVMDCQNIIQGTLWLDEGFQVKRLGDGKPLET